VINTCNPIWSQSFVYSSIRPADLASRVLEVTIWDYDRYGVNEFLGEVTIDLGAAARASAAGLTLDALEATWHALSMMQNGDAGVRKKERKKERKKRRDKNEIDDVVGIRTIYCLSRAVHRFIFRVARSRINIADCFRYEMCFTWQALLSLHLWYQIEFAAHYYF
jgi:hypothetical protein